jgi:hypothetical protein
MAATRLMLETQRRMLEPFLSPARRKEPPPAPPAAPQRVETAIPASAGDKPAPVRRGKPPKARSESARPRRGRSAKKGRSPRE